MDKTFAIKISTLITYIARLLVLVLIGVGIYFWRSSPNPAPADIKPQINFKLIYPGSRAGYKIDSSSWRYQTDQKSLTFKASGPNTEIVITEQKTPGNLADNSSAYSQLITTIRPYTQFMSPLGNVALTKFWTKQDYQSVGQTAVLNSHGTFFLAHPNSNLTDEQWQSFFNSLKISR